MCFVLICCVLIKKTTPHLLWVTYLHIMTHKVSLPVTITALFRCVSKKVKPLHAGARPGPAPDQRETKNVYKSPTQKNKNLETTSLEISFAKEYQ